MKGQKLITAAVVLALGIVGYAGYVDISTVTKEEECENKEVQIEYGANYYCSSNVAYVNDGLKALERFENNEVHGDEFGLLQVYARNDAQFAQSITDIMVVKYDPVAKEFDGTQFDNDFRQQLAFASDLASIKCNGACGFDDTENLTEQVYNLLSN